MTSLKKVLLIGMLMFIIVGIALVTLTINKNKKSELDIFYNDETANEYEDIRNLSRDYNIYDAQMD